MSAADVAGVAGRIIGNIEKVIIGKRPQLALAVAAYLCEGHILLEDVPGVAKTMFARALARRGSRRPVVIGDDRALTRAVALLHRQGALAECGLSGVPVGGSLSPAHPLGGPTSPGAAAGAPLGGARAAPLPPFRPRGPRR